MIKQRCKLCKWTLRRKLGRYPRRVYDRGVQAQRTSLAWQRSSFVCLINSLLFLRKGYLISNAIVLAFGLALLLATAALYLYIYLRSHRILNMGPLCSVQSNLVKALLSSFLAAAAASYIATVLFL